MTDIGRDPRRFWTRGRRSERVGYLVGAALLLSGLAHLVVQVALGGPWLGPVSWRKPVTFGLSFGLTAISVTWATSFLRVGARSRVALQSAFLAASVVEVTLISVQAWRRVPSHFNFETPFDTGVTATLAAGGLVLVVALAGFFIYSLRAQPDVEPTLLLALRLGFGSLMVALATGAIMIAIGTASVRAGDPMSAYHVAGRFKPAHAVAMHGIAVLPGLAWWSRGGGMHPGRRRFLFGVAAAGYLGLVGCSFLLGPGWTWVAGGCCAAVLLAAGAPLAAAAIPGNRSAGLGQGEREHRGGAGPADRAGGDGHGPAAVDHVVDQ
ncbi:MAG TPA: hypothetical protein VGH89_33230 [Pseudonocardia sp.]|jgi:hypothetical protein